MSNADGQRADKLKVFISWSGEPSKAFAEGLKDWLKKSLQCVEPFVSSDDIDPGTRSVSRLAKELGDTNLGIICLTQKTINRPWILFEAGAMSKAQDESRVWIIRLDVQETHFESGHPLTQFQYTEPEEDSSRRLFRAINSYAVNKGFSGLDEQNVIQVFEKWWPDLKTLYSNFASASSAPSQEVSTDLQNPDALKLLNEALGPARSLPKLNQRLQRIEALLQPASFSGSVARLSSSMGTTVAGISSQSLPDWNSATKTYYPPGTPRHKVDGEDPDGYG